MKNLTEGLLTINIEEKENEVNLNWQGDSRDAEPAAFLDPYFREIIEAMKSNGKKLIIDFKNLNSMNSSTVLPILTFIRNLEESSITTEIAMGMTLDEAMALTRDDIAEALGGLPPNKMHCSNLAIDGLHKAIEDYRSTSAD